MNIRRKGIYHLGSRSGGAAARIAAVAMLVLMVIASLAPGAAAARPAGALANQGMVAAPAATIGGVNLGSLTDYLFFFANGSTDANWQGATKGFVGDVAVDGIQAAERTSGGVPYAGTIYTNDSTLGAWASIVDQNDPAQVNPAQAFGVTGQTARITGLEADLNSAFSQINALTATPGYTSVAATALNGLDIQNGTCETYVVNITSGLGVSSKINVSGDACDAFILRWDTDGNPANGYQGQAKFQSGGGIVPLGGLKPSNFINVAGDIGSSGGGSNPTPPYPQGPRLNDGTGALIVNGANFAGGGFFTGYWLTTGKADTGETSSLSNGIFVGGWYSTTSKFSMTSGTSGVHVSPNTAPPPEGKCVTLQPDATAGKDAYIKQENVSDNLGNDSELRVKSATDNKVKRSLLQFDLSGLPMNAVITSASLSLYVKSANGGAVTVNAHPVTRLWDEGSVTWNTAAGSQAWTNPGGDYGSTVGSVLVDDTTGVWRSWDVTNAAAAWVGESPSNYGVILEAPAATTAEKVFKSSDDGTAAEHPKLLVCYNIYTPDLQVTKSLATQGPIYVGQNLSYSIDLSNIGQSTLSFLPLRDWYDPAVLQFVSATPAPDVAISGALTWYDLSTTLGGLAPGQHADVIVTFKALAPTTTSPLPPAAAATVAASGAGAKLANALRLTGAQQAQRTNVLAPTGGTALDSCGYPYASSEPRTSIVFNESTVLKGFYPVDGGTAYTGQTLKVWYSDEHALTLGVRQVQIKNGTTTNYPITAMAKHPADSAANPQVGTTLLSTDQAGTDLSGRPMWPALFITDLYGNPSNRSGDWQLGGAAIGPHAVFGTWKGAVRIVDNSVNPPAVTITPDVNPVKNNWALDLGDPAPAGLVSEGYGAEVRWDLSRLVTENGLTPGHTYRFQFMVHDGDQNKSGGDVGEACTTITFAPAGSIGDRVWYDANSDKTQQTSEPGINGATVNLYGGACPTTGRPSGTPLATQVTVNDGNYDFGNLAAGAYCVAVDPTTLPAGMTLTTANEPLTVNLGTNQNYNDADFGYVAQCTEGTANLATVNGAMDSYDTVLTDRLGFACTEIRSVGNGAIGDFVWYDANANGIEDVGEPGLANVTLDLYQNNLKIDSTVTDADGGYMFHDLPPGSYTVDVTDVNGVLTGMTHIIAYQSQPDPNGPISLNASEVYKDSDFGYVKQPGANAIIGDTVWYDANADGFQQPDEAGIPGIQVCATPVGGGGAICATTDPAGHYLIQAPAGSYNVGPTNPPANYTLTNPPAPALVTVAAGQQYLDADFGYDSNSLLGTIGNLVFLDANKNGVFDAGDSPLGGVSVTLIRDTNGDQVWETGEPVIATVTTATALGANNANYLFTAVPAGAYLVHVSDTNGVLYDYSKSSLGAAGVDGNNQTDPYPVTIPAGGSNLTADFGYCPNYGGGTGSPTGIIGNQVWIEKDGNGLFGPANGDFGQPGVTVELLKDGVPYAATTTGASGDYAFLGLPAGSYSVQVTDDFKVLAGYRVTRLGPNPGQDNNNQAQPYAVVLPDDRSRILTADFGYIRPGVIGDYVWYDTNANQIQDVGEPGIGNVTLRLYRDNGDNVLNIGTDTLVGMMVSDSDGGYVFTGLIPGVYFVDVDQTSPALAGLTHMSGPQSQPDPFGPFTLTAGQVYRDADFGYFKQPASGKAIIGDTVWYDANGDGVREQGEPGIAGIQVCATPTGGGSAICATTDVNGLYHIEVPAGSYTVAPTNPPAGAAATTPVPHGPVTVNAGDQYLNADFGYKSPNLLSLGGTVWNDLSNNGVLDAGEPGIPSVSVDLIQDSGNGVWDAGEPVIATTTTDQAGNYSFVGLPPGSYLVVVSDTQNVLHDFVVTVPGPNPGLDNNNQVQPYALTLTNASNTTADFGYMQSGPLGQLGVIGNQVWYETDGNGIYNPGTGDTGVAGVTVALYRNGQPYATTTTGASGDYVFTSLPAGNYSIQVTDSFGVLSDLMLTVLGPNPGQDNNNQAQPYAIALLNAGMNMTADFGYTRPGAIGDFVWYDTNGNGIEEVGEPGIANVTLDLYRGAVKVASTVTDADGGYLFPDLPPGIYTVDVTDLNGMLTNMVHVVGNQSQPDPTATISLAAGDVFKDADFGYRRAPGAGSAIIGDTVWYDANGDGIQQPGEVGIPGIQVCATPIGGGSGICATTDSDGHYLIVVPAGSYNVAPNYTPPAGVTATTPIPHPVVVQAGNQFLDADFGYYDANHTVTGSIGNLVFRDVNKNGAYDAGDSPLAGVSVDLIRDANNNGTWDPGEPVIGTVTTVGSVNAGLYGSNGNYAFPSVPAGNYLVHVSDTNGVLTDFNKSPNGPAGGDDRSRADPYAAAVAAGGSNLAADFGYWLASRPGTGVIGNQVWIEADGNGLFDVMSGDFGQAGVTVELLKDGQPYDKTTTGAGGDYAFVGLPSGNYSVKVGDDYGVLTLYSVTAPGPSQGQDNNNQVPQPYAVALPIGGYNLTADFGYLVPASSIGDTVYYDDNRNGQQDTGEVGISGVTLQLFKDNGGVCNQLVTTTATDGNGKYIFANLPPAHYCVVVPAENPFIADMTLTGGVNPYQVSLANNQNDPNADFGYAGKGIIRGVVYLDLNGNGLQERDEPGIPGVKVCLYADADRNGAPDSTTPLACTTTSASGTYTFGQQLPGGYVMTQTLPAGLANTTPLTITTTLVISQGAGLSDNNNFGDNATASYTITKRLVSASPTRPGLQVTFEIEIKNTGGSWISFLPLQDVYNNTFLTYGYGGQFSTPSSNNNDNDGVLNWSDLTAAPPYGFGADLAPGETRVITVNFTARADTSQLPGQQVINYVTTTGGQADPDGPNGPLASILSLPDGQSEAPVTIYTPTGVTIESFAATPGENNVLVSWRTASEADIIGFNVLRADGSGELVQMNGDLILAQHAGADAGADYSFEDAGAAPGVSYTYVLEIIKLDGSVERRDPVAVTAR